MMTTPTVRTNQTGMKIKEKASPVEVDSVAPLEKRDGRNARLATPTIMIRISSTRRDEDFLGPPYPCDAS